MKTANESGTIGAEVTKRWSRREKSDPKCENRERKRDDWCSGDVKVEQKGEKQSEV